MSGGYGGYSNHGICFDFIKGKCTRGDSCRFSHEDPADEAAGKYNGDSGLHGPISRIQRQVEYYLSDENLETDKFFLHKIQADPEGWLDMDAILSCRRMKQYEATKEDVFEALKLSKLEVKGKDGGPAAVRRPPDWALPGLRDPAGSEKRLDPCDSKPYTFEEVKKNYAHMEFSDEEIQKFWDESMKKVEENRAMMTYKPPEKDQGDLPGRLVALSRLLGRILRHQAEELELTVNVDGFIPLGEVMQLNDRFPGQYETLGSCNIADVETCVDTSLSDGYPRFELKQVSGVNYIRARHNMTLPAVNPNHLPPQPSKRHRQALTDNRVAGDRSAARRTAERLARSDDDAAAAPEKRIDRDGKPYTFEEMKQNYAHMNYSDQEMQQFWDESMKKVEVDASSINGDKKGGPDPWTKKDPWRKDSSNETQQSQQTEQATGNSSNKSSHAIHSEVQKVGDQYTVRNSCKQTAEGYLSLTVGDVVKLQYIGKEASGDVGWMFGIKVASGEQGWLPQSAFDATKQELPEEKKHPSGLTANCEATVIQEVIADPALGFLQVKQGVLIHVLYVAPPKSENDGWAYGYVDGKKDTPGWIPCKTLKAK